MPTFARRHEAAVRTRRHSGPSLDIFTEAVDLELPTQCQAATGESLTLHVPEARAVAIGSPATPDRHEIALAVCSHCGFDWLYDV